MYPLLRSCIIISFAFLLAACSPETKKTKHLENGDRYYQNGDYDRAEVEYLNLLRLSPQSGYATGRLGLIYTAQGRTSRAIAYLLRGHELSPNDLDVRLRIAQLYLASGKISEARAEVNFILERKPQDTEAPSLLIATMADPSEADAVKKQLLNLPAPASTTAPVLNALGLLELRLGRLAEAEALLQQARIADESFASTYSVMAALQIAKQNLAEADKAFEKAAQLSPPRSPRHIQYAQFKIRSGDPVAGIKLLEDLTKRTPDYLPAWVALAEVNLSQNKLAESDTAIGKVLGRDPQNLEALILRGRLHQQRNEYDKALTVFEKLATSYPQVPIVHQELGRTYLNLGDLSKAGNSLSQAMALAPKSAEVAMLLARVHGRKGDANAAVALLRGTIEQFPNLIQAQLLLAETYRSQGNFDAALVIYEKLEQQNQNNSQIPMLKGAILFQQRKIAEARASFEKALALSPENGLALEQLVNLYLQEKKYLDACSRVEAEISSKPKLQGFGQLLLAKIMLAQEDKARAETYLKRVIELMPESPTGYFLLAGIYARSQQEEKALAQLAEVLSRDPKQVTALMLTSVIQDQRGNYDAAKEGYEKLLAINPRSMVALNNLAYLYSERFNELEKAHDLAQRARQLAPNDPHNADTLGWILHKKRQYPWALSLLLEAAEKLPTQPEIQFHLGLTHYVMGVEGPARAALARALQLNGTAPWAAQAKDALSVLNIDSTSSHQAALAVIDKALSVAPDDPVALARLSTLQEQEGKIELAIASLSAALKSNPHNVNLLLNLARLHGVDKNPTKALEYAKEARKQAPEDANVAQILGRLAYENRDYPWSASLLQEASRKQGRSRELQYDYALASYSVGRVNDATTALGNALNDTNAPTENFTRKEEAREMLQLILLANQPAEASAQMSGLQDILAKHPDSVPALMAIAVANESQLQPDRARQCYEKVLSRFPDFIPAKYRLVVLSSNLRSYDQKTYERALQIRQTYPGDSQVAKVLGIQNFLKGDSSRAIPLLKESLTARQKDAELHYYLGQALLQTKDIVAGKASLQQSLKLGLGSDMSETANRLLQ